MNRDIHPHLWGYEEWLVNTELYCAKYLILKSGVQSSYHYHTFKDETFIILAGEVRLEIGTQNQLLLNIEEHKITNHYLKAGDRIRLMPLTPHRFRAITQSAIILEVSTHHEDSDSFKIEESKKID